MTCLMRSTMRTILHHRHVISCNPQLILSFYLLAYIIWVRHKYNFFVSCHQKGKFHVICFNVNSGRICHNSIQVKSQTKCKTSKVSPWLLNSGQGIHTCLGYWMKINAFQSQKVREVIKLCNVPPTLSLDKPCYNKNNRYYCEKHPPTHQNLLQGVR